MVTGLTAPKTVAEAGMKAAQFIDKALDVPPGVNANGGGS